jgi:protein gp37
MVTEYIKIDVIGRDPEIQAREEMNQDTLTQYSENWIAGIEFPPVLIFFDGQTYWLADGWHRVQSAEDAGLESVPAEIRQGTRDDALWEAVAANKQHDTGGQRRTNADKRRAVEIAVKARPELTGREIADHVGVDPSMVTRYRATLQSVSDGHSPTSRMRSDGKFYPATNGKRRPEPIPDIPIPTTEYQPSEPYILSGEPEPVKSTSRSVFNQTNEMVEWAWWTWNPVTGCEHNCVYCYARDIANRFYPEKFTPTFRPERLEAPRNTTYPEKARTEIGWRNVFVCSMADLFGRWVPDQWIEDVFTSCRKSPQWNYLFLTKFPLRYESLRFPETAWVGTSVDEQRRVANAEKAFAKVKAPIKWLSVEPLREPLKFTRLDLFDWVVIGGQSVSTGAPEFLPPFEWVADIVVQAKAAGCQVYIKPNIGFDGPTRPREYPHDTEIYKL